MKKRLILILAVLLAASFTAKAQEIRDIETTVYIFANGTAMVVQTWDVTVVDGTEYWIPIDNPGKSYVHDFKVFENGEEYENEERSWNSRRSLEEKAGRCGIVEKDGDGIELCWGLGSYGDHKYTIMYVIDHLALAYKDDCVGFHWHFLNDEWQTRPQHVSITFVNETELAEWYWNSDEDCNVRFWGFGMKGDSRLEDGKIIFESSEPFVYRSFFSALIRFEPDLFNQNVWSGDGKFEKLKKKAMKGSDYKKSGKSFEDIIAGIVLVGLMLVGVFFVLFAIYLILKRIYMRLTGRRYDKKAFGCTKIDGWWRDIPLDGNPLALYSIIQEGDNLAKDREKVFPNLVSAYFLKWIQDGLLAVENDPKKEGRLNLRFVKGEEDVQFSDKMENTIYKSARQAAGGNMLLEADEFKDWSWSHDREVCGWPSEAIYQGRPIWQAKSEEERVHAIQFMKFLKDFTVMDERDAPEVALWQQYMILAATLGVADKVARNFSRLFPAQMAEYYRQTNMASIDTMDTVIRSVNATSRAMMSSALDHKADREYQAAQAKRSSGGGGSISFGGGGGGFGGGHGGGTR